MGGKSIAFEEGYSASVYAGLKGGFTEQTMPILVAGQVEQYAYNPAGWVIGGGVGFPMPGLGGVVSLNAGVGLVTMQMTRLRAPGEFTSKDSLGYSYGMSYSYPFTETMGLTLDVKGNSYEYMYGANAAGLESISEKWTAYSLLYYVNF